MSRASFKHSRLQHLTADSSLTVLDQKGMLSMHQDLISQNCLRGNGVDVYGEFLGASTNRMTHRAYYVTGGGGKGDGKEQPQPPCGLTSRGRSVLYARSHC